MSVMRTETWSICVTPMPGIDSSFFGRRGGPGGHSIAGTRPCGLLLGPGQEGDFLRAQRPVEDADLIDGPGEIRGARLPLLAGGEAVGAEGAQVGGDGAAGVLALVPALGSAVQEDLDRPVGPAREGG